MPDGSKKHQFIIDYVLTIDSWKLRRFKKHRVDVMTYSQAGSIDAILPQNLIEGKKTLQKTKSDKNL